MSASTILCGTCAWGDHEDFYPRGVKASERLPYYAKYFPLVEVDSSFYAIPNPAYVERWAAQTPDQFRFNMKIFKGMTGHERHLSAGDRKQFAPAYRQAIQPMVDAGKLTALLLQLPPWFTLNRENVDYLRWCREFFHDLTVAVEFRHRSWYDEEIRDRTLEFLKKEKFVNTIVDEPQVGDACIPTLPVVTDPKLALVRFHGRNTDTWYLKGAKHAGERFKYHYSRQELAEWIPQVQNLSREAEQVHLLWNNNHSNFAVRNAFDMMELLGQPFERAELPGNQLELF
ncbi:DUF72 domain-containing protein [Tumebacillus sp. ITR2]|uniref:DUF72 domain-containing protein n=1 Tax=Tumebacillus amylolyticus TaxID=2801339 RepID=A0ABS1JAF7_9BACL|nr:DUF72 domain-containing protein [Tumebacillus amylolyticus]